MLQGKDFRMNDAADDDPSPTSTDLVVYRAPAYPEARPFLQPAHRLLGIPRLRNYQSLFRTMLELNTELLQLIDVLGWIPQTTCATEDHADACPVCLEPIEARQPIYMLHCSHCFHCRCLQPWIMEQRRRTCPMCRQCIG